jgi:hypothetical protein
MEMEKEGDYGSSGQEKELRIRGAMTHSGSGLSAFVLGNQEWG